MSTRTFSSLSAALLLLALAAGCGDDDGGSDADRLSKAEAKSALLSQENMGDGFKVEKDEDDEEDAPGCLDDIDDVTDAPVEEEISYVATTESELPSIANQVSSYDQAADAIKSFKEARAEFVDCKTVSDTDDDGIVTELKVTTDDVKSDSDGDEQFNVRAVGTITSAGQSFPVEVSLSAVRLGNNVVVVNYAYLGLEPGVTDDTDVDAYVAKAVERLIAVADGETPSDAQVS